MKEEMKLNNRKNKLASLTEQFPLYPLGIVILSELYCLDMPEVNPTGSELAIFFLVFGFAYTVLYILLSKIVKNKLKAALFLSLILLNMLFFRRIGDLLLDCVQIKTLVLPIQGILFASLSWLIFKTHASFKKVSSYLNLLLGLLIVSQLFQYAVYLKGKMITLSDHTPTTAIKLHTVNPPDIYYIIVDSYTASRSLKKYWNYDNHVLENYLKSKGFYIAENSKCNYNQTPYSLSTSLNMSYLQNVPRNGARVKQYEELFGLVDQNRVSQVLKQDGYCLKNYTFFPVDGQPPFYKDYFFKNKKNLFEGTIFERWTQKVQSENFSKHDNFLSLASLNLKVFKEAQKQRMQRHPQFIYAHVMMPHPPFIFKANGTIDHSEAVFNPLLKDHYLAQLEYTNKLLIQTVNHILANYPDRAHPIIIIQGDHGYRYLTRIRDRVEGQTILNAYYFPDHNYQLLYPRITPVNSFRVVFNHFFNAHLRLLHDDSYNVLPSDFYKHPEN